MRVASFDIGKDTFSWCVEELQDDVIKKSHHEITKQKKLLKTKKRIISEDLLLHGRILTWQTHSIVGNRDYDIEARKTLFSLLQKNKEIWETCQTFVIEQQQEVVRFKQVNPKAVKIGEAALSWLIIHFPNATFDVFCPVNKTRVFDAPKKMKPQQRKQWSCEKAEEILTKRDDQQSLSILLQLKKKDDISDAFMQLQAWKQMRLLV
jgi:hypothetical protein